MRDVNITLTQTFVLTAHEGTYSAAARRLNISYQSVANHIRRLEQHVGERLVDASRGAKAIRLTPRGVSLYRLLSPEFEVMLKRLGNLIDKERPVIRIGLPHAIFYYLLPPVLSAFRAKHPDVEVVAYERDVSLPDLIREGVLDVCLSERHFGDPMIFQRVLCEYRPVLVFPSTWPAPLGESDVPRWAADRPLVTYEPGHMLRSMAIDYLCVGDPPRIACSTSTSTSVKRCVEQGLGFAVVPMWCFDRSADRRLSCLPLTNAPEIPIYFGEATFLRTNAYVRSLHRLCTELISERVSASADRRGTDEPRSPSRARRVRGPPGVRAIGAGIEPR